MAPRPVQGGAGVKPNEICTYCDAEATTDDHVPPQLLFPLTKRSNLVEVPACLACNHSWSQEDENLRSELITEDRAAQHPEAAAAHDAFMRALRNPAKLGFRKNFFRRLSPVELRTPEGLRIATGVQVINLGRVLPVVDRIIRGLFRYHVGRRLPLRCRVQSWTIHQIEDDQMETVREMLSFLKHRPKYEIGSDGAFRYSFAITPDNENGSVWSLEFYKAHLFVGATLDAGGNWQ
jgi:hypothetical protein